MAREPVTGLIRRFRARRAAEEARSEAVVADELDRQDRLRERLTHQLTSQWEVARAARRAEEPVIDSGPSNFSRAQVPWGLDLAAAWSWRFIVIAAAGLMILWTLRFFAVLVLPLVVALFIAALVAPVVDVAVRARIPRKLASLLVVVLGIASVALLLTFVGQQVAQGIDDLSQKVAGGLGEIRSWLQTGPLHASDSQINDYIERAQRFVTDQGQDWVGRVTEVGVALGHILAGFFIVLFATYFFLADGKLIWAWVVRIFPRAARLQADASGRVAWRSLTQFVRATVLVAGTDAIGIMIVAAVLKVPLVGAIGVLVFLGAFVPMIGAFLSGTVAVLVALVDQGPVVALIMLGGVVLVQQIEAHVLQPFLMGRFVSVHPLGVIIAIAAGVIVAGIAGALVAVPLAAALNSVVQHLAGNTEVGEDADEAREDEPSLPDDLTGDDVADLDDAPPTTEATLRSEQ
ncbi:MAG TPA: AI-2E family transporter [Marmoricola sp.]|nr:AI-2E family transporter [Marmoricola sp.]